MKNLKLFLCSFIVAGMFLTSCSSDDNTVTVAATLTAKWNYHSTITSVNGGTPATTNYPNHEANCDKDYQEFGESGVFKDVVWNKNSQNQCVIDDSSVSTYSKSAMTIVIVSGPKMGSYEITKLTGSELRYKSVTTTGGQTFEVTQVFTKN